MMLKRAYCEYIKCVLYLFIVLKRSFARHAHKRLKFAEWCIDNPEQFDHYIDLYYQWGEFNSPHWLERGIFNLLAIKCFKSPYVIELCCGEEFNSKYFYASSVEKLYACDFDKNAIKLAKKKFSCENIQFAVADIRNEIPEKIDNGRVTNVIFDMAIEHFTLTESDIIMKKISEILSPQEGILSGCTIVKNKSAKSLEQHEYEFESMHELKKFLSSYFTNVKV